MGLVFEHADGVFKLLKVLVRRPPKGELSEDAKGRNGIPVVCLEGDEQGELTQDVAAALRAVKPSPIPHEVVDVSRTWSEVTRDRPDLPPDWQRSEFCRRVLVELAQEFSSASNGRDMRVRFRRFGLVNWLLETEYAAEEPDPQYDRELLRGLREREFRRRRLFGVLRSPETEVAMQGAGQIPWWVLVLGLHVFPIVWFRAWRGVGTEYRWLLRQPYMAPRDPGTFVGFGMRLTQPRWGRENPEQVGKLMINAFLEDLRAAYRRRIWRRRPSRRTAYCVALLRGVTDESQGTALIRSIIDVRNDTGAFDPLVVIASGAPRGDGRRGQLSEDLYRIWCNNFWEAGRSRTADVWYLPVTVPEPLHEGDADHELHRNRVRLANQLTVDAPPRWTRRGVTVTAVVLVLALLGAAGASALRSRQNWQDEHCGLSRSHPDAATLKLRSTGECVGVAPNGFAFDSSNPKVKETLKTIARQNDEADRLHETFGRRPVVTLVYFSALLSSSGQGQSSLAYAREALQGAASAQRRQLDKRGNTEPVLRIYPANGGMGMRFGPEVVGTLKRMMRTDKSIVGVTGLEQSRRATATTIKELTKAGLPMVATTLSADSFDDHSPMYYQVSPQNRREAAVATAYASDLVEKGDLKKKAVRTLYSADPRDEYSHNLQDDVAEAMEKAGFEVEEKPFKPSSASAGKLTPPGPATVGENTCGYPGLVFFAGRSEDFESVLSGANAACGSNPPAFLGGDDVARLAADPERRDTFPKVPFEFLDFTVGSRSCDNESDLYSTMRDLFPEECKQLPTTSLDGHATLAFDAVNLYVKAVGRLRDTAPDSPLTPHAVWHALSSIHGRAALDGESGKIDFGGVVDQQIPVDKLISVQRVDGEKPPEQMGFCGRHGRKQESKWCPGTDQPPAG